MIVNDDRSAKRLPQCGDATGMEVFMDQVEAATCRGNDRLLFGIVLGVLAFWLCAQTTLNFSPVMAADLQVEQSFMNVAVSITALFSGIFIVVIGGLADKVGRVRMVMLGFVFSIVGSLLIGLAPPGSLGEIGR